MTSILQCIECKWCMYDTWNKCSNKECKLIHPRRNDNQENIKILDMLHDLNKNLLGLNVNLVDIFRHTIYPNRPTRT